MAKSAGVLEREMLELCRRTKQQSGPVRDTLEVMAGDRRVRLCLLAADHGSPWVLPYEQTFGGGLRAALLELCPSSASRLPTR